MCATPTCAQLTPFLGHPITSSAPAQPAGRCASPGCTGGPRLPLRVRLRAPWPPAPQHDVQLDYYGKRLATCSSDRTVKVYDVMEGGERKQVADLKG